MVRRTDEQLEARLTVVAQLVGEEAEFLAETAPEHALVKLYQAMDEPGGEKKFRKRFGPPGIAEKGEITLAEEVHCWEEFLKALEAANAEYVRS